MTRIAGSILIGFGIISLVLLEVHADTGLNAHFNPFKGFIEAGFFGGREFYPWTLIINMLPLISIVVGFIMILSKSTKNQ